MGHQIHWHRLLRQEVEAVIQEAPQVDIVSYNTLLKGYAQRSDLIKANQAGHRLESESCGHKMAIKEQPRTAQNSPVSFFGQL